MDDDGRPGLAVKRFRPWLACAMAATMVPTLATQTAGGRGTGDQPAPVVSGDADTRLAYDTPTSGIAPVDRDRFARGRTSMLQRWVVAPSPFGLWGRGPTSNGEACTDCHAGNGRGRPPESPDEPTTSAILRLSVPGTDPTGGPLPHPVYGTQLQSQGILGEVPAEGQVTVAWRERPFQYPDGDTASLREPEIRLRALAFGPLGPETRFSLRVAPPLIGLGLLEAIPDAELGERAHGDGRPNRVPDLASGKMKVGRFGWKASQPDILHQVAGAFHEDLGITSYLHPDENCPGPQRECTLSPSAGRPEIARPALEALAFYLRNLAAPDRRNRFDIRVLRGESLFAAAGCVQCHTPEWTLGNDAPSAGGAGQVIRPYTDLLLHNMGPGLGDGRQDYAAGPADWRTPPLWGLGLSAKVNGNGRLLHDGRARSPEEAILWHGGEAEPARARFIAMNRIDRDAVLRFLSSL